MPLVEIAFDIWEHITAILGDEDKPDLHTLNNLSLSCKAMLPLCRNHLFSILSIDDFQSRAAQFCRLFSANSDIARYIRHLSLYLYHPIDFPFHEIFDIVRVSPKLRALTVWSMTAMEVWKWDELPTRSQIALEQLIHLPTVTSLDLMDMKGIPLTVFRGCNNITHISLMAVEFGHADDQVLVANHRLAGIPRLHSLDLLDCSWDKIQLLMRPYGHNGEEGFVDFRGLKKIQFLISSGQPEGVQLVPQVLAITEIVESIKITNNGPIPLAGFGAALFKLTSTTETLKKLGIRTMVMSNGLDPLFGVASELKMISGVNHLEQVVLNVLFVSGVRWTDKEIWSAFDTLFTTPGSFPMLKVVKVKVSWYLGQEDHDDDEVLQHITRDHFPKLCQSKMLHFRSSIDRV